MIKSMTGYGKSFLDNEDFRIDVEVRSLNSKFLDLSLRAPKDLGDREIEIRKIVTQRLNRGKVSLALEIIRKNDAATRISYDEGLFKAYYDQLRELAQHVGASTEEIFRMAIQSPEVTVSSQAEIVNEEDWNLILSVLDEALNQCDSFRTKEGSTLFQSLIEYLGGITELLDRVEVQEPGRVDRIRERIDQGLSELQSKMEVDRNRMEQELIYYLERLDISEEMDRLRSHLDYFRETLDDKQSQGKKLGFIAQEMGREINTIGSKANQANIQKLVVAMKDELEKIKEQLYNIL